MEEYDGTNWTSVTSIPTATLGMRGSGTQTDALAYGGGLPSPSTQTIAYDGTAWSTRPSLATARTYFAGFGATSGTAVAAAGAGVQTTVEEYSAETSAANIVTVTTS